MSKYPKAWERNGTRRPFPAMYEAQKMFGEKFGFGARIMLSQNIANGVENH